MVFGSLASAVALLAVAPSLPGGVVGSVLLLPFGLLVGAVVGGAWGALPGVLKAYGGANEVITTIMLNFIATNVAFVLVTTTFQDPNSNITRTASLPEAATFRPLLVAPQNKFSILALLLGGAFVVGTFAVFRFTRLGYSFRISGLQEKAAKYGGIDADSTIVSSMTLSGALGGIGGALWAMMVYRGWTPGMPPYGFDGITVSILAANNPIGVLPAAALFGVLKSGSVSIDFATSVPNELVGILRGLIILFVAMPGFFRAVGRRVVELEPPDSETDDREVPADG
jgi:simple sugar transport system permease protein